MSKNKRFYFRWSVILICSILIFIFFSFFASKFGQAKFSARAGDKEISITTKQLKTLPGKLEKFDSQEYYKDSKSGFTFKLPKGKNWSKPEHISGYFNMLEAKNVIFAPGMREQIEMNMMIDPLWPMTEHAETIRITSGDIYEIEITDETTNDIIKAVLNTVSERFEEDELSKEELFRLKRELIGFERLNFSNELTITIYNKKNLRYFKPSLPGLFNKFLSTAGLSIDQLVTNEEGMLAGLSSTLERVKVNDQIKDWTFNRWFLLTENQNAFFLVEIAYSPQSSKSIQIWEELRSLMDSFHVIE